VAGSKHSDNEMPPAQRRIALTRVYLRMACPEADNSTRAKHANSILALIEGDGCKLPQQGITDAQAVEAVWRNSQCIHNRTGKCPLLVFGRQLAEEINEFFKRDE
jgi:hypothetical protein